MWIAPGRWPSCHSSCSRTSSRSGRSGSSRRSSTSEAGTSSISSLTWARSSRYVAITFKSIASWSRSARGCRSTGNVERVAPAWSRLPFLRERPHPHDPRGRRRSPSSSAVPSPGSPPLRATSRPALRPPGRRCAAGHRRSRSTSASASTPRQSTSARRFASTRPASAREAEKLFARHDSLEARVGESFSNWPNGTVAGLTQLSGLHPKSAAVQLNLGIARFWAGEAGAEDAWKSAASLEPDTAYAVTAGNLLHPDFARNLPIFVPSTEVPADIRKLPRPRSWRCSSAAPRTGTVADRALLRRRAAAAREAALGRARLRGGRARRRRRIRRRAWRRPSGSSTRPARPQAFSRLGPLSREFPKAATVRFHLGLLLLWSGQVKEARRQLELVRTVEPGSPLVAHREPVSGRASQGGHLSLLASITKGDFLTRGRVRPLRSRAVR